MRRNRAFTLVELLVVVGIIALLIGILLPSLSGARRSAKNGKIKTQLHSLKQALEMFRNDVGEYPESEQREDPTEDSALIAPFGDTPSGYDPTDEIMYGAQWMVRGLVGKDMRGYVVPRKARKKDVRNPARWYDFVSGGGIAEEGLGPRETIYLSGEQLSVSRTADITAGIKPQVVSTEPEKYQAMVLLDAYERPILYYRAEPRGRVRDKVLCTDGVADFGEDRIPYYRLGDNELFTGNAASSKPGWKFAAEEHRLQYRGNPEAPDEIPVGLLNQSINMTFAKYIHNHAVGRHEDSGEHGLVQPYNPEGYLLISAGPDGVYGTEDDIKNFGER